MTVPPPVIAANRTQLASLVATNLLGQNGPAIAVTEVQYGQMWAQDAAAMYGYAAQSATATKVPSFTTAPQTTTPGALAGQAAATTQAAGTSTQASLSQLTSAVPTTLQGMASPATSTSSSTSGLSGLESLLSGGSSGNSQLDSFWSTWGPNANIWNTLTSTGTFNPAQIAQTVTSASFLGPSAIAGSEGLGGFSPLGMAAGLGSGTHGISGLTGLGAPAHRCRQASANPHPSGPCRFRRAGLRRLRQRRRRHLGVGQQPVGGTSRGRDGRAGVALAVPQWAPGPEQRPASWTTGSSSARRWSRRGRPSDNRIQPSPTPTTYFLELGGRSTRDDHVGPRQHRDDTTDTVTYHSADSAHVGDIEGALGRIRLNEQRSSTHAQDRLAVLLAIVGPGLTATVGDNDAGGVATYVQAGADARDSRLWVLLLSTRCCRQRGNGRFDSVPSPASGMRD